MKDKLAVVVNKPRLGTPGRLALFAWSLTLVLVANGEWLIVVAALALSVNGFLYPASIRRLFRWRWLIFVLIVLVPNMLWVGDLDRVVAGIPISTTGFAAGIQMVLRALVVIVAVDGFSGSVDITEVAGLFERIGLPGLGFSMGVAVNLLPDLRRSGRCAWQTLSMRGGLRRQWWRGIQLLLVTVVASALRRADEIALSAEIRAYTPGTSKPQPLRKGVYDVYVIIAVVISIIVFAISPI